jgi:hypothetical protein
VDIDPETGKLPGPSCPRILTEAFLQGSEPVLSCDLHRDRRVETTRPLED